MVRTGKGRLFVVDGGGKLVLGDEPSLAKGFPLLSNLAVPWEIDCGSLCMQRFQTAIETASEPRKLRPLKTSTISPCRYPREVHARLASAPCGCRQPPPVQRLLLQQPSQRARRWKLLWRLL